MIFQSIWLINQRIFQRNKRFFEKCARKMNRFCARGRKEREEREEGEGGGGEARMER